MPLRHNIPRVKQNVYCLPVSGFGWGGGKVVHGYWPQKDSYITVYCVHGKRNISVDPPFPQIEWFITRDVRGSQQNLARNLIMWDVFDGRKQTETPELWYVRHAILGFWWSEVITGFRRGNWRTIFMGEFGSWGGGGGGWIPIHFSSESVPWCNCAYLFS